MPAVIQDAIISVMAESAGPPDLGFERILAPRRREVAKQAEMIRLFEEDPPIGQKFIFGFKGVAIKGTIIEPNPAAPFFVSTQLPSPILTVEAKLVVDSRVQDVIQFGHGISCASTSRDSMPDRPRCHPVTECGCYRTRVE